MKGQGLVRTLATKHWPIGFGLGVFALLLLTGVARDFADGLVFAALIYLAWGMFRGSYHQRKALVVQIAGVVLFGFGTIAAIALDDTTARIVLAIGWFAHAIWDVYHYRHDIVVARWWAEQCAVVDVAIAAFLLWPLAIL